MQTKQPVFIPTVTNLRRLDAGAWAWHADTISGGQHEYRTNEQGEGLFVVGHTALQQVMGTRQFAITAKTTSGVRRQIKRQLSL